MFLYFFLGGGGEVGREGVGDIEFRVLVLHFKFPHGLGGGQVIWINLSSSFTVHFN